MRLPNSGQLKQEAKLLIGKSMHVWFKATLLLIGLQILFDLIRNKLGGRIGWYLIPLTKYSDAETGFFSREDGFDLVFRMQDIGQVAAISLTYQQIIWFLLINLLIFVVLAPIKIGILEQYWKSFRGEIPQVQHLARWYTEPKRLFHAIVVELVVNVGCRVLGILLLLPSSALYIMLYGGTASADLAMFSLVALLALSLLVGGAALAFFLYTMLYPICYCLAARPDYSLGQVFRRGIASIRGYRSEFFRFRLSFFVWYFVAFLTYGVMDLYILPYISFASFQFLQEAAKARQNSEDAPASI